jgi:steroid 5-alpha reductase family enzyme
VSAEQHRGRAFSLMPGMRGSNSSFHFETSSKAAGVLVSVCVYALAFTAAVLAVRSLGSHQPLVVVALGDLVATMVVFAGSVLANNSSIYDPYWSVQPAAIAGYYLWLSYPHVGARQVLVAALAFLYALRLTSNFYRDWPGLSKEDFRYADFRRRFRRMYWPVSFVGIHLFPTVMVYLGCLPLYAVMQAGTGAFGWLDILGTLVTLAAVVLAFVADEQLRVFRRGSLNKGKAIRSGLWKHSRHPNYLGEMSTWWGFYAFALGAGLRWWWTGVGALAITLMFVFISVPLMERRELDRRSGYREYAEQTPALLPFRTLRKSRTARSGA